MYTVFGFYKFKKIKSLKKYQLLFQREISKNNVKGTIILSSEGINGTIAGKKDDISKIIKIIKRQYRLKDFDSKNISESLFQPFHKGKIKIKNEVVPLGLKINPKNKKLNRYVSGKSWNKLISNKETLVIDARKPFEYEVGTFKNSINPKTANFKEFPEWVKKQKFSETDKKQKKIAMFCTGGIRCEKASAFMKNEGFEKVYHLKGGILKYLEETETQNSLWQGECFVFDDRVSVKHDLSEGSYDLCHGCRMPITEQDKLSSHYVKGVSCSNCVNEKTSSQIKRYKTRQKQINLAKAKNKNHLGPKAS